MKKLIMLAMVLGLLVLLTISASVVSAGDDWLRKIDGRRYTNIAPKYGGGTMTAILDVIGNVLVFGYISSDDGKYSEIERFEIQGRETRHQNQHPFLFPACKCWVDYYIYTFSEDGDIITTRAHYSDGTVQESVYFWQR